MLAAAEGCPTRTHADWCTTLTVGSDAGGSGTGYGFVANDYGSLDDPAIDHGTDSKTVERLVIWDPFNDTDLVTVGFTSGRVRHGAEFNLGGTVLTASAGVEHSNDTRYQWNRPADLAVWLDGQEVTVSANLPPSFGGATVGRDVPGADL